MIIDKYFVFLHVPKTGGTWIRNILRNRTTFVHEFKDHRFQIPTEQQHKPVFAFVRNPWDFYVSAYTHYHHNWEKQQHEFSYRRLGRRPDTHQAFLEKRFGGSFEDMILHQKSKKDFISKTFETLPTQTQFLRYEDGLANALIQFFEDSKIPYQEAPIRQQDASRFNAHFQHRSGDTTYTQQMNDIVLEFDNFVISRWDYSIPEALIKRD